MLEKDGWLGKYSKYLYLLLLLIPIALSVFLRVMPAYLPGMEDRAENYIDHQLEQKIAELVKLQYSHLALSSQKNLIKQQLEIYKKDNAPQIDNLIKAQAKIMRAYFQDDYNQTYLYEMDPWHWYRLTQNYIRHGYEGDIEKNGKYYDMYIYAGLPDFYRPASTTKVASFHVFIAGVLYKLVHFFNKDVSFLKVFFYLPVLFSILAVVPAFFIARKLGGNIAGFFSALIVAFHWNLLFKTVAGFSDTDIYSVLFPLLILWLFVEIFSSNSLKKKVALIIAGGFLIGIYSFAWVGWWYTFYLVLCGLFLIIGTKLVSTSFHHIGRISEKIYHGFISIKVNLLLLSFYIIFSLISVFILKGLNELVNGLLGPFSFLRFKEISVANLWPNIYSTVAELKTISLSQLVGGLYSPLLLFIAVAGFLFLCSGIKNFTSPSFAVGFLWISLCLGLTSYITNKIFLYSLLIIPLLFTLYFIYTSEAQRCKENLSDAEQDSENSSSFFAIFLSSIHNSQLLLLVWYIGLVISLHSFFSNTFLWMALLLAPFVYFYVYFMLQKSSYDSEKHVLGLCFSVVFLLWLFSTMYSSLESTRFIVLLVPPVACGFGLCAGFITKNISHSLEQPLQITKVAIKVVLIILFLLVLTPAFIEAYASVKISTPTITDTWYVSLIYVKEHSNKDAIITSWWDYGHWFKAIADRPVTIDGGTQSAQQVVYIGKLLLTADEKESAGILRVLSCGSYAAYESMEVIFKRNKIKTRDVLDRIILLPKDKAADVLKQEGFTVEQVEKTLEYTHCNPPQSILVLSEDMIDKAYSWSQVGLWDFKRAQVLQHANQNKQIEALAFMQKEMNMSGDEAATAYAELKNIKQSEEKNKWVAPQVKYISSRLECGKNEESIVCGNGINLNLTSNESYIDNGAYIQKGSQKLYPLSVSYINKGGVFTVFRNKYADNKLKAPEKEKPIGTSIVQEADGRYYAYFMGPELVTSMFNRLYFYNGVGLECFKLLHTVSNLYPEEKISIWTVNWDCLK